MWRIRSCKYSDLNDLLALSKDIGEGMTSMPMSSLGWRRKIAQAEASFAGQPDAGSYFLVLEDINSGAVIGTTAVYTGVGEKRPFYALRHDKQKHSLFLEQTMTGASEIGSLFLSPNARVKGLGRALSQARFLMMATFPQLFSATVMATCRGWLDDNEDSPVWQAIGRYYEDIEFNEVVERSSQHGTEWLAKKFPQSISLRHISPEVLALLGMPHSQSAPAHSILREEHFVQSDFIDLADGGPTLTCQPTRIASYQASVTAKIQCANRPLKGDETYMLACGNLQNFEIIICRGERQSNGVILVDSSAATLLDKHLNKRVKALQIKGSDEMMDRMQHNHDRAA
jgi:arginine N-succinyltransferase